MSHFLVCLLATLILLTPAQATPADLLSKAQPGRGPLRVHPANPRCFTDDSGRAIYLGGHQVFTEIQDNAWTKPWVLDWPKHLEFMKERNLNYLRNWINFSTGDGSTNLASPMPYARTGPGAALDGQPKFDLRKFDESYFERLHDRIQLAQDQGIVVSIMLFEVYGFNANIKDKAAWDRNIFNGKNNVNGIDADPNGDSIGLEFFYAPDPVLRRIQRDYVKKVIDSVNGLNNVIFEVANECGATQWQHEVVDFIHDYEAKHKPKRHLVLMSPGGCDVRGQWVNQPKRDVTGSHADLIAVMSAWADYKQEPPANEEGRPAIMDMDHINPSGSDDHILPWKAFTRSYHYSLYDHPFENRRNEGPSWDLARRNVGAAVSYSRRFSDLAAAQPHNELSSTKYCLAQPGRDYLVLQPISTASFTLKVQPGQYRYEWFRPETAKVEKTRSFQTASGVEEFKMPFVGPAVLYIAAEKNTTQTGTTYWIAPDGSDGNSGTDRAHPWKTFAFAVPRLSAGDTLVLRDGEYNLKNSGALRILGSERARSANPAAPITVKAEHERQAFLRSDGSYDPLVIQGCSYWTIEGIHSEKADNNSEAGKSTDSNVLVHQSDHITLRRLLVARNNRYANSHLLNLNLPSGIQNG